MGRSILAVVVGYVVVILGAVGGGLVGALVAGPEAAARAMEGEPLAAGPTLVVLVFGLLFAVLGGYVAALLARHRELRHATYLAVVMFLLSLVSMVMYWGQQPAWFQFALLLLGPPAAVVGGWLKARGGSGSSSAGVGEAA